MKMIAQVTGIKRSKGVMRDTGKEYDSTTVWLRIPFDESPDMRGFASEPFKFGTAANYAKFDGLPLPFEAEVELETVTTGKTMKQVVMNVVPLPRQAAKQDGK